MPKKLDPLNKKLYGAVSAMLTVTDIKAAVNFYKKAFGFASRGIMNGPDGTPIHAELKLRDTIVMLGPEVQGARTAKKLGGSAVTLFLRVEKVDKVVANAVKLGAKLKSPVGDMFWGDRCGIVVDPDGNDWMIATHIAEPTPKEMSRKMKEMMGAQAAATTNR